jgi:Fe-S-cluster containining protein
LSDIIIDCTKCEKQYICCRAFRVELSEEETKTYQIQTALKDRKNINIVAQCGGNCVYFDVFKRTCKIWDNRPHTCREYDCSKDPRVDDILKKDVLTPLPDANQKLRLVVSVTVMDEKDKRRVAPMVVYSKSGPNSCETFEVRGNGPEFIEQAKKMLEMQIKQQVGNAFKESDQCAASDTNVTQ